MRRVPATCVHSLRAPAINVKPVIGGIEIAVRLRHSCQRTLPVCAPSSIRASVDRLGQRGAPPVTKQA